MKHARRIAAVVLTIAGGFTAKGQTPSAPADAKGTTGAPPQIHLTLEQAQAIALKNNPKLSQAQYTARAYDEVVKEFRSAYYPTLDGNVTAVGADSGSRIAAGALNNPVLYSRLGTGVSVSQLITDFGRTHSLVQSASLNAQAEQQAFNFTRADVLLQTEGRFYAVLRAQKVLTVAHETVHARQLASSQVQALYNSKLKSGLDLSFAKVNVADAQLLESTAENDVLSAYAELARVLNLPPDTTFNLDSPKIPAAISSTADTYIQQALQQRPDLLQRRLEVQSAQQTARAEKLLSRPTLGLAATAGYVPAGEAPVPGTFGGVGVNLNIPVFNGGLFRAREFAAEEKAAADEQGLRDLELRIRRDVQVAWLNARNAYQRLGLTQQLLDEAKLALDLAQARYKLGLSSIVELSQSQLQYTSAAIAQARARFDYSAQTAILKYQAGILR